MFAKSICLAGIFTASLILAPALSAQQTRGNEYWPKSFAEKQREAAVEQIAQQRVEQMRQAGQSRQRRADAVNRAAQNQTARVDAAHRRGAPVGVGGQTRRNRGNRFIFIPQYQPWRYARRPYYSPYPYYPGQYPSYYYGYPAIGRVIITRSPINDSRAPTGGSNYFGNPHGSQYFGNPHGSQYMGR